MLIKDIIDLGLTEKEAKTYLALLELEVVGVQEIATKAGINRSTAYVTLKSLKKRGLVGVSDDPDTKKYIATPPEAILRIAENDSKKYTDIRNRIAKIIPEIRALHKDTKARPLVKVFEGKDGLINSFEDTLTDSKEKLMRVSSSPGNLGEIMASYFPEYLQKRFKLGIKMKGIHPNDEFHRKIIENNPNNLDTYVLVPKEKYKFPADLAIYDNKIGLMSGQDGGIALTIENKVMADVMKSLFDLAFEEAKRLDKASSKKSKKK